MEPIPDLPLNLLGSQVWTQSLKDKPCQGPLEEDATMIDKHHRNELGTAWTLSEGLNE